jgi:hypothetical protein
MPRRLGPVMVAFGLLVVSLVTVTATDAYSVMWLLAGAIAGYSVSGSV